MPMGEHVSTQHQGRFTYEIFVHGAGRQWEWEVNRMPNVGGKIIYVPAVAEGRARTRDAAIAAAQAACQDIMEKNRNLDGAVPLRLRRP
jgi:hypothetical protein